MAERAMRLLDKSLQLVRVLTEDEVEMLIATGKVEHRNRGKRRGECLVLLCDITVRDFQKGCQESQPGGPALQSVYRERHCGKSIAMIKRSAPVPTEKDKPSEGEQFHRWDAGLTFAELRANQIVSQETRQRIAEREHRNRHIISFLAWEEYDRHQQQIAA